MERSASRRSDLTFSNPLSLFRKASMANESSKFFLFSNMFFPPLFEKGLGQGGTTLKHAARRLDGIIRDRFDGTFRSSIRVSRTFLPGLSPIFFRYLSGNNDLAFGEA